MLRKTMIVSAKTAALTSGLTALRAGRGRWSGFGGSGHMGGFAGARMGPGFGSGFAGLRFGAAFGLALLSKTVTLTLPAMVAS